MIHFKMLETTVVGLACYAKGMTYGVSEQVFKLLPDDFPCQVVPDPLAPAAAAPAKPKRGRKAQSKDDAAKPKRQRKVKK